MKILFLTQTNEIGASARYRVYQYLDYLKKEGIDYDVSPSVDTLVLNLYNRESGFANKFRYYYSVLLKRLNDLKCLSKYDLVFLQRDIMVHFYPFIEKLIALSGKKIIFDFDDAIFLYPPDKNTNFLFNLFWDKKKIERIIKLSNQVIVGNRFLEGYALRFNRNVTIIPTSIDLNLYQYKHDKVLDNSKVTIGWIGSQGTFGYLKDIFPELIELAREFNIELRVVGAKGPESNDFQIKYKNWSLDTEIQDINDFDIGLMPLSDDLWSRGKSATKLLQYMASGVPAVVSPVGANKEIICDGVNGYLAENKKDWIKKISNLIENATLRRKITANARCDVENFFSVQANALNFVKVIKKGLS